MSTYRGRALVVRRDRVVTLDGEQIGQVYPTPGDSRVNHGWSYVHASGITLRELHPDRPRHRVVQDAFTKIDAAKLLADLHLDIDENPTRVEEMMAERSARIAAVRMRREAARQ